MNYFCNGKIQTIRILFSLPFRWSLILHTISYEAVSLKCSNVPEKVCKLHLDEIFVIEGIVISSFTGA